MDNGGTTKVDSEIIKNMNTYHELEYGNPSSNHQLGLNAKKALDTARKFIAESINAKPSEIIFTSGGTESNNMAIKSIAFTNKEKGNHIITTKVEHKCILNACKWLESQGFTVTYLDVDKEGFLNPELLKSAITEKTILVSAIHGNNEIGTINDIEKIGAICRENKVYLHTDACQSYTKTELDVKKQNLDLVTINAHKIHGPKGIGALYVREGIRFKTWQHGGGQERNLRNGTENIPAIVGFAKAIELASNEKHIDHMTKLRDKLIDALLKIPDVKLNGPMGDKRLANNINFAFKYIEGEALGGYLDEKMICSSSGSACSEKTLEPSYVLQTIGLNDEYINGSLRLTISRFTTEEEIDFVIEELIKIVDKLREMSPFYN